MNIDFNVVYIHYFYTQHMKHPIFNNNSVSLFNAHTLQFTNWQYCWIVFRTAVHLVHQDVHRVCAICAIRHAPSACTHNNHIHAHIL